MPSTRPSSELFVTPAPGPVESLQEFNRRWWEKNPMTYDWARTLQVEVGSAEFFREIDERFFRSSAAFGHPDYPKQTPFSEVLDYAALQGRPVLEIGCGAGGQAAVFARQGARLSAIDITEQAVTLTRRRFALEGLPGAVQRADAERQPFASQTFDLVWSWGVIHHTADIEQAVREIHRVLKPGGAARVMVYHRHSLRNWIHGGLAHGILRGKLLRMSYNDVLKSVTDGYIARQMTRAEAARLFKDFRAVTMRLTDLSDLSHVPGYVPFSRLLARRLLSPATKLRLDRAIMERWGWFLYIEAVK